MVESDREMEGKSPMWKTVATTLVMCAMTLAGLTGLGTVPRGDAQDLTWMAQDRSFTFQVQGSFKGSRLTVEDGEIEVAVVSVDARTIRLSEVYWPENEGDQTESVPSVWTYVKTTRENLDVPGRYAWAWVSQQDASAGTANINGGQSQLTETTPTHWIFVQSSPNGNTAKYWFDRTTGLLATAERSVIGPDYTASYVVKRESSGLGGRHLDSTDTTSSEALGSAPSDMNSMSVSTRSMLTSGPRPLYHAQYFGSPWWDAWGWNSHEGGGLYSAHSSASGDRVTGRGFTEAGAYAGVGVGWAGAHGFSHVYWPSSSRFTVTASGAYRISTHVTVDGWVGGNAICNIFPWGGSSARSRIMITSILREATTWISVGEVRLSVFDWGIGTWYWEWPVGYGLVLTGDYYLNAGTSYFGQVWTRNDEASAAWGICGSYAHSHFSSTLNFVEVIRL